MGERLTLGPLGALSVDLDETLLDGSCLQDSIKATCAMLAEALPDLDVDQIRHSNARAWEAYWAEVDLSWRGSSPEQA